MSIQQSALPKGQFNPKAISTFSLSHFLNDLVTTGMVPALVVLYKQAFQLTYTQGTMIVLVSYLTSSITQPLFGKLTDKKPKVWFYPLGVFLSVAGLALTGIAPSFLWLLLFVAISGFGSGIFHPEASRGTHLAAGDRKGFSQALFQVGGNAGQAFGPLMIPLFLIFTGIEGLIWLLPVAFLSLLITVPYVPWLKENAQKIKKSAQKLMGRNRPFAATLLVVIITLRSFCQVGVVIFLPFYLTDMSLAKVEVMNFLYVGAGALGTLIGGMISDRIGLKRILVGSMALATPFSLIFASLEGVWAIIVLFLFGFFVLSSFSVTVVYMQRLLPQNVALASGLSIGFGVGAGGIGSIIMGGLSDLFGVETVFILLSLLPLIGAMLSLFLPGDRKLSF